MKSSSVVRVPSSSFFVFFCCDYFLKSSVSFCLPILFEGSSVAERANMRQSIKTRECASRYEDFRRLEAESCVAVATFNVYLFFVKVTKDLINYPVRVHSRFAGLGWQQTVLSYKAPLYRLTLL